MAANPEALIQVIDAGVHQCLESCWTNDLNLGPPADIELSLGSCSDLSNEASNVSIAASSSSSSCCCSEDAAPSLGPDSRGGSMSCADLASLSTFFQREFHTCVTDDGWKLHITRVCDTASDRSSSQDAGRRHHPVLMIPGLASSGKHTFDLLPEHSLVNVLVSQGYDIWMADLRGNGRSQKPSLLDTSTWWCVDDHFLHDLPAVMDYVLAATGMQQLHYVGHSMGGMLAVGLQSQHHRLASSVRSITMLASGCFGSGSWHGLLKPLISKITGFGFPAGAACWVVSKLSGTAAALLPIEALFYWPTNMPTAAARQLMANCFQFIPPGVIQQFLGSLNTEQGLTAADGSFLYADPQRLQQVDVPVLALNGTWDLFCPAAGGRRTVELFGSKHKRAICMGPTFGTGKLHYGHFDIMSGKHAAQEVFPHVLDWLQQHDVHLE